MMGFAGLLSLGHALYIGLGAYTGATLYVHFGIVPWLAMPVAAVVAGAAGALIGFLGFRFSIRGVYFALLTIAFAEFTRVLFDHWEWVDHSVPPTRVITGGVVSSTVTVRVTSVAVLPDESVAL